MSADLTKARQQLGQVRSLLRDGKTQPAVSAVYNTVVTILKTPLMKSEKDEFDRMLDEAVYVLSTDAEIKKIFPMKLTYAPGEEKMLLELLRTLLEAFDTTLLDAAQEAKRQLEARKRKVLEDAEKCAAGGDVDKARNMFAKAARDFRDDAAYIGEIGELCVKYSLFEDAIVYLEDALARNPSLAHLYNQIGMVLRRTKQFQIAEKYYLKASEYLGKDPNLFFNLGRVYVDWGKWRKAALAAGGALKLDPDFHEAQKLLDYVEKKMKEDGDEG
jgi:tetratricopeptide (TPR) repeat protein